MSIVDFLRARLDEDEQAARAAADHCGGVDEWDTITREDDDMGRLAGVLRNSEPVPLIVHFARHDPARVLREVAVKREAIVEAEQASQFFTRSRIPIDKGVSGFVLRMMAAAYADHPDYQEDWRL